MFWKVLCSKQIDKKKIGAIFWKTQKQMQALYYETDEIYHGTKFIKKPEHVIRKSHRKNQLTI